MTAGVISSVLIRDTIRAVGNIKPKRATATAACIRCFRKLSFAAPIRPNNANKAPNAAGINAVKLAAPVLDPCT